MDGTDKQTVFAALSYLLSYPDEEWRKNVPNGSRSSAKSSMKR